MCEQRTPIDPTQYSTEYFLTECDGHAEYLADQALSLTPRLQALWDFLGVRPGMKLLDIGCGRGEIVAHCAVNGVLAIGIDYSEDGIRLAQRAIMRIDANGRETRKPPHLCLSNAKRLPFPDNTFDRVVMSDIVEHLHPRELKTTLQEVCRALAPGGELLVHTMPNLWYYRYGYPLFRLVQRLRKISLPTDPRERFRFSHVHVNEQTPRTLRKTLGEIGFSHWRVWLYDYRDYSQYGPIMRRSMRLLTSLPLVKRIFCDDIFAVARR
jgi:SAM-dependent methyltransferase